MRQRSDGKLLTLSGNVCSGVEREPAQRGMDALEGDCIFRIVEGCRKDPSMVNDS